jgi:hypothetical protein
MKPTISGMPSADYSSPVNNLCKAEGGYRLKLQGRFPKVVKPTLSIITVTLNAGKALQDTIDSVKSQPWDGIEHIVIDGGSTDATVAILQARNPELAYWRSQPDKGIYDAMNIGLSLALGRYVLFLNSGDLLVDQPLVPDRDWSKLLRVSKRDVFGRTQFFKLRDMKVGMPYSHQGILFRNHELIPFDTRFRIAADYQFLLDNLSKAGLSAPDPGAPGYVAFDSTGVSSTRIYERDCESARIIRTHFGVWHWARFWAYQLPKLALRWLLIRKASLSEPR